MALMAFDTTQIWDICRDNEIGADSLGQIEYGVAQELVLIIRNSSSGTTAVGSRCILITPALLDNPPRGWMNGLMRFARDRNLALSFRIQDAAYYRDIFVVGSIPVTGLINLQGPRLRFAANNTSLAALKVALGEWIATTA